jgi:hypothetical protein
MRSTAKRLRFVGEEAVEISEGVATNRNGRGVEFESRNFKA